MSIPFDGFERAAREVARPGTRPGGESIVSDGPLINVSQAAGLRLSYQSGLPMMMLDMVPLATAVSTQRNAALAGKRWLDVVLSVLGLIFFLPMIIVAAIAIRLESRGPILFRQPREGLGGQIFLAYKFRSMRVEAGDISGLSHTTAGDSRVTRVGAFLRRTSIDELPQLLNVLRGEMSIVGPRPHVPNMLAGRQVYRDLVPYYDHRLDMLPGITGWAQANGLRGDASNAALARARIDHDMAYIQNFSLWLDLRIVLMTIRYEFIGGSGS